MHRSQADIRELGFEMIRTITAHPESAKELLDEYADIIGRTPPAVYSALYKLARAIAAFRTSDNLGLTMAMRAYELARGTGDAELLIQCVSSLGTFHFHKQEYEEALTYFLDGEGYFTPDVAGRARFVAYFNIAETYRVMAQFDSALEYFQKADDITSEDITDIYRTNLYNNMGNLYAHISVSAEALLYFNKAAEYARRANSDVDLARAATNSADTYVRLGAYKEALAMAELALSLKDRVGDEVGKGYAYMTLAKLHTQKQDYQKAHSLLDQAQYVFDKEVGATNRKASCAYLRGEVFLEQGRLEEALERFKTAETLQSIGNNPIWILQCRLGQARVWKAQGDVHRAEIMLKRHRTMASETKSLEINSIITREMADLYESSLNYKMAYTSLRKYNQLQHDSFVKDANYVDTSRNTILKIAQMERKVSSSPRQQWMLPFEAGSIDIAVDRAFQHFPLPFWITSEKNDGLVFVYANTAFEKATGLPRRRIIGKPLGRVVHSSIVPRLMRHARSAFRTSSPRIAVERIVTPNGPRDFRTILIPFSENGAPYLLSLAEDITEAKNKQRAANRSTHIRSQQVRDSQQFLSGIAHELRTQITTLVGYRDLYDDHALMRDVGSTIDRHSDEILMLVQALSMVSDDRRTSRTEVASSFDALAVISEELNRFGLRDEVTITRSSETQLHLYNYEVECRKALSLLVKCLRVHSDSVAATIHIDDSSATITLSSSWSVIKDALTSVIIPCVQRVLTVLDCSVEAKNENNLLTLTLKFCSIDNECIQ